MYNFTWPSSWRSEVVSVCASASLLESGCEPSWMLSCWLTLAESKLGVLEPLLHPDLSTLVASNRCSVEARCDAFLAYTNKLLMLLRSSAMLMLLSPFGFCWTPPLGGPARCFQVLRVFLEGCTGQQVPGGGNAHLASMALVFSAAIVSLQQTRCFVNIGAS